MSGFTADWLALREPADAEARDAALVAKLCDACAGRDSIAILDLGAGTGASPRYLAPRLPIAQRWTLVDGDEDLLHRVQTPSIEATVQIETRVVDLAQQFGELDFGPYDLVTASALMDLVAASWFDALAARCREAGVILLFTLTYDGRILWSPEDPHDGLIAGVFNAHQERDKGFGPALGPAAPGHMAACLTSLGYRTYEGQSDWRLGPEDRDLQVALLDGYAEAATESDPGACGEIDAWRERRGSLIDSGRSSLQVGHIDIFAEL